MPGMLGGMYPGPQGAGDVLSLIGATLRDASPGSSGDNIERARNFIAQRAMMRAQMGMMGRMGDLIKPAQSPQYDDAPPINIQAPPLPGSTPDPSDTPGDATGAANNPGASAAPAAPYAYHLPIMTAPGSSGGLNIMDPETQRTLSMAAALGIPGAKEMIDLGDKARPTVKIGPDGTPYDERSAAALMQHFANRTAINNQVIDLNDSANTNRYIPTAPMAGAIPVQAAGGQITDFALPRGSAQAIGAAEAAKVGATEAAKLPYVGPAAYAQASGTKAGEFPYAGPIARATSAGTAAGSGPYENITVDVGGVPTTMSKAQFAALQGGQAPSASFGSAQASAALSRLLPGSIVTSGARSLNRNAAVGGVPNSLHTVDGAVDFVPPKGADINAFRAKLTAAGLPASELINEGNHWHWGFAPKGGAPTAAPAPGGIVGANKDDQKRIVDLQAAAKQGEDLAQLGHQFMKLNGGTATGPGYSPLEVPIPFAHSEVNLNVPGVVAAKMHNGIPAMDNLSTQMALALRAPGQRITQMEFQKNLQSVPGKEHLGPQNMTVVKNYDAMAANRRAYADFASNWLAQHGSLTGMDEAFKASSRSRSAPAPVGAAARLKWNPQTGALQ